VYNIPIHNADPGPDGVLSTRDDPGTFSTYFDYPAAYAGPAFQQPMLINDPNSNATQSGPTSFVRSRLCRRASPN
jgi:hypothetical protein